ncbi:MAG TPA: peptidase S8 [Gammaproteobacteria bacterium]|nr:peptidase S8 [Gammaproteobacteria bacterium]
MSRSGVCKLKLLLVVIFSLGVTSLFAAPPEWVDGELIVKPLAGLSDARFEKILSQSKGQSVKHLKQINAHVIKVAPQALDAVMRALSSNPHIDYVEKNPLVPPSAFTPNDPGYPEQWHLSKIQASVAWGVSTGNGVTIAVLDSGVEDSHPDLAGSMVPGWNVVSNNSNTSPIGLHGTAVAGAVAATGNNGIGVASIAWRARIMPVRISNRSDGWADGGDMADGILWAADHGARVVNISYDIGVASSVINDAAQYLRNKGGLLVMSAGNNNTNNGSSENPYIINVAATTDTDARASFSNYGNYIDVSAPGEHVVTTWENGGYGWGDGTSFSSPLAAGVIALIKAANPNLSVNEVETILKNSADDLGASGWDRYFGHGRVNAAVAVQMATQASPSDTQAPKVIITSPAYSSTVNGTVLVDVVASDDTGVTRVTLYANGRSVGSDSTAPYRFSWDSSLVADGNATLTAYAYDAAGNTGIASGVTVNVENQPDVSDTSAPTVRITNPVNGSTVGGTVSIYASASDNIGVTQLSVYIDNRLKCSSAGTPSLGCSWNTRKLSGTHTITAVAKDAAGNSRQATVSVAIAPGGGKGKGRKK